MIDAGWLRELGSDDLAALLRRRPDVCGPPQPVCLAELAARLCQPMSVLAALRRLDRPALQVAETLAALGGEAAITELRRLLAPAGHDAPDARAGSADADANGDPVGPVDLALERLRGHGLLTGDDRPRLVDAARLAWPAPLGLGPPAAEFIGSCTADDLRARLRNLGLVPARLKADLVTQTLDALRDASLVRDVVAHAPDDAGKLLRDVAHGGEPGYEFGHYSPAYGRPRGPRQWALARGLLFSVDGWGGELAMPAEVALALRGPRWRAPFDPDPPHPALAPADEAMTARDAAANGAAFLRLVCTLLDEAGRGPIPLLKSGGIGVRELRRLGRLAGVDHPEVRLALAVAHEAGLLALSAEAATPTAGYDEWLTDEPGPRLADLIHAWWALPYPPTGTQKGAWSPAAQADDVFGMPAAGVALPEAMLRAIAELPGQPVRIPDPGMLADLMLWRQPYAIAGPDPRDGVLACWWEAGLLGVVGAGALSAAGRALLDGGDVATALADLGTTERTVRIQADLTAIVAGTPSASLSALLDEAAERESRGAASSWRFTPASVRRALDAGRTPEDLLAQLSGVAADGLPQPLEYLVRDVARRHGAVRVQEVTCCLRADDPALLAEVAADRRLRGLGLRVLAPTVLAGARALDETLAALRSAGYAPMAERADGTPVLERIQRHRATKPARGKAATTPRSRTAPAKHHSGPDVNSLARTLLDRADVVAAPSSGSLPVVRRAAQQLDDSQARLLAYAIDAGLPVCVTYVNQAGNVSQRTIQDIELSGNTMLAWCRLRQDERMFNLGRVIGVAPAGKP